MLRERKNIRLKDWDYTKEGCYFLTICCMERQPFFGRIENNKMLLSDIGSIASQFWIEIPNHFAHTRLDEFVIMPNHLHGIIILDYSNVGSRHGVTLQPTHDNAVGTCHGMSLHGMSLHGMSLHGLSIRLSGAQISVDLDLGLINLFIFIKCLMRRIFTGIYHDEALITGALLNCVKCRFSGFSEYHFTYLAP